MNELERVLMSPTGILLEFVQSIYNQEWDEYRNGIYSIFSTSLAYFLEPQAFKPAFWAVLASLISIRINIYFWMTQNEIRALFKSK